MRKQTTYKILLVIYLILLIWQIIFKLNFSISDIHEVRDINLIPFHYENVIEGDIPLFEALLNVLVFVPLGFLLHVTARCDTKKEILTIAGLSLCFEIIQYVFAIGATDITDVITNTIGGIIGVSLAVYIKGKKK